VSAEDDQQGRDWEHLYESVIAVLRAYGHQEPTGQGDFWVLGDNYNDTWFRQIVFLNTLKLLDPTIVAELRQLLRDLPHWEIVIAIDIPGKEKEWPPMGLRIRRDEIIDSLIRALLPAPYNALVFPDSRPGTGQPDTF
jgi:hypothetical protein